MAGVRQRRRDHDAGRHPVRGLGSRLVVVGHRRAAAGAVRLPGRPGLGRGAGRAGLHDRDRPVPQADRQAGPVRRGVRRHLRPAVRARRPGRRRPDPPRAARCTGTLQDELMLFYTGITRSADTILQEQTANIGDAAARSSTSCATSPAEAADGLRAGDIDARRRRAEQELGGQAGAGLRGVEHRSSTRPSTRPLAAGATGAKVTGAGGGGFVLVVCPLRAPGARCGTRSRR